MPRAARARVRVTLPIRTGTTIGPFQATVGLDGTGKEEGRVPLICLHREAQVFARIDGTSKRAASNEGGANRELPMNGTLVLLNSQPHTGRNMRGSVINGTAIGSGN